MMCAGTRIEVRIDEILEGSDPYEPKWVIAVADDGKSYLLYGVRHDIPACVGDRAIMEFRTSWVLIEKLSDYQPR